MVADAQSRERKEVGKIRAPLDTRYFAVPCAGATCRGHDASKRASEAPKRLILFFFGQYNYHGWAPLVHGSRQYTSDSRPTPLGTVLATLSAYAQPALLSLGLLHLGGS